VLLLNASEVGISFQLPSHRADLTWERVLDTAEPDWDRPSSLRADRYRPRSRARVVLRAKRRTATSPEL
jgi:hypothetical protein